MTAADILNTAETAALLGVARRTVQANAAALGGSLVFGKLRFRRALIDAYLDRQRVADHGAPASIQTARAARPLRRSGVGRVTGRDYSARGRASR